LANLGDKGEDELASHFRGRLGGEETSVAGLDDDARLGVLVAESHELLDDGGEGGGGVGVDVHMRGVFWVLGFGLSLGAIWRQ
jgi:hypothetical protein